MEKNYAYSFMHSEWLLHLEVQCWEVEAQSIRAQSLKYFLCGPLEKKLVNLWLALVIHILLHLICLFIIYLSIFIYVEGIHIHTCMHIYMYTFLWTIWKQVSNMTLQHVSPKIKDNLLYNHIILLKIFISKIIILSNI